VRTAAAAALLQQLLLLSPTFREISQGETRFPGWLPKKHRWELLQCEIFKGRHALLVIQPTLSKHLKDQLRKTSNAN